MEPGTVDKVRERYLTCRKQLNECKKAIAFWSQELRVVTEILVEKDQKCFEFIEKEFDKERLYHDA